MTQIERMFLALFPRPPGELLPWRPARESFEGMSKPQVVVLEKTVGMEFPSEVASSLSDPISRATVETT